MINKYKLSLLLPILIYISGCSGVNFSDWRFPYMMEVQQGNYITSTEVNQMHSGMTKEQVSFIIGRPLTQFMFGQNRWDFFYQDYKSNRLETNYCLTMLFDKDGKVISITKTGQFFNK